MIVRRGVAICVDPREIFHHRAFVYDPPQFEITRDDCPELEDLYAARIAAMIDDYRFYVEETIREAVVAERDGGAKRSIHETTDDAAPCSENNRPATIK